MASSPGAGALTLSLQSARSCALSGRYADASLHYREALRRIKLRREAAAGDGDDGERSAWLEVRGGRGRGLGAGAGEKGVHACA